MPEIFDASEKQTPAKSSSKKDPKSYSQVIRDNHQSTNPLDAFALRPTSVVFDSQLENEEVLLLLRQHPITQIKWILIVILLLFVPYLLSLVSFWDMVPDKYHFFGLVFWYLLVLGITMEAFLSWFYNVYIVTDERIIDVDFFGLLYKNVNTTQIRKIEDVNYSQVGMMSSMFNYGNVIIQTAAEQRSEDRREEASAFTFEAVSNPDRVVKVIGELMEQEEKEEYEGRIR